MNTDNTDNTGTYDLSAYDDDDRGNVVDFYCIIEGTDELEYAGRLDREGGPAGNELEWENEYQDPGLEEYARSRGYGEEIDAARKL